MEDAATAEISRSQLWQWRTIGATLDDGSAFDGARYARSATRRWRGWATARTAISREAAALLDGLVLDDAFAEFLTLRAYPLLG